MTNPLSPEQLAQATEEWNNSISKLFIQADIMAMRGMSYISPGLHLDIMESVVLHAYVSDTAKSLFENNPIIYPEEIRNPGDFNWGDGILIRVGSGDMPAKAKNRRWSVEKCKILKDWVTKYWPDAAQA